MKTNGTNINKRSRNITFIALAVMFILLLPLLAMQITDAIAWDVSDFVVAGALLFGTGLAYELIAGKTGSLTYRAGVGLALATAFLLVWANLAVGIIGSEDNPANLMYIGVLAVAITGALIARFQPHGMALALYATALVQACVAVIAMILEKDLAVFGILAPNGFFIALWAGSALLFRHANATLDGRPE